MALVPLETLEEEGQRAQPYTSISQTSASASSLKRAINAARDSEPSRIKRAKVEFELNEDIATVTGAKRARVEVEVDQERGNEIKRAKVELIGTNESTKARIDVEFRQEEDKERKCLMHVPTLKIADGSPCDMQVPLPRNPFIFEASRMQLIPASCWWNARMDAPYVFAFSVLQYVMQMLGQPNKRWRLENVGGLTLSILDGFDDKKNTSSSNSATESPFDCATSPLEWKLEKPRVTVLEDDIMQDDQRSTTDEDVDMVARDEWSDYIGGTKMPQFPHERANP